MSEHDDQPGTRLLRELEFLIATEPEADRVLRETTALITRELGVVSWAGIYVAEEGTLQLGPRSGSDAAAPSEPPQLEQPSVRATDTHLTELSVPVVFDGTPIGLLVARTSTDPKRDAEIEAALRAVAERISEHCLVGWDTGGVAWEDVS